ncbi:protein translocase subunit SecF [Candidatus Falkowbacteria bacterium CG_4_9_14_3_um_filter_38_19]|uniref:Protein-export membrane protein SecF n=2 Tax=Candidatus Falkowiibacteriota TaxID=1752728 RepID=A0A2M6WPJ3_9BACT|nr:protein translocase subunit SecF [Candidatus Kuenenbacteria bacterium]PIT94700.1 MAG: protein translocase subunit SecF [Candidatus Falkowbacteria bacterium CG10_big_fil_rev_8_21_14_0_10_38_22]PJB15540.1 MAG: protein translocase subunit SecF [Candidatus Falkowbacteria bacterium CG_4_9_14_3_um_filter_38_19]
MTNYKIIQKRNIWLTFSGVLFVTLGLALLVWGFKYGIDFTGGSLLEVKFLANRPVVSELASKLADLKLSSLIIQPVEESNIIFRFQQTDEETHQAVLAKLNELAKTDNGQSALEELRFDSVGPSIGAELKRKSLYAIFFVLLAILLYITYAFRKVSKPVASWKYGTTALIALVHDAVITLGIFAALGKFYNIEINTAFVAAVLTVLGYSVHDTIVVFDRLRENLPKSNEDFEGTVNISLNQTLVRSINTSLTVLLVLGSIILFGGSSIRTFALTLAIGIFFGTYSSIFVAPPILVIWEKLKR